MFASFPTLPRTFQSYAQIHVQCAMKKRAAVEKQQLADFVQFGGFAAVVLTQQPQEKLDRLEVLQQPFDPPPRARR